MDSLSVANAQFCFDVFKEMSCDHTIENVLLSPLSLLSALAVVLFGARGNSASQMEKVSHRHTFSHVYRQSRTISNPDLLWRFHRCSFLGGSDGKESACNPGDPDSILGSGRSPGEGNGYPF